MRKKSAKIKGNKDNDSSTKICSFQMYRHLYPKFDKKVEEEFGPYKKSKIINTLIEGYINGKYRISNFLSSDSDCCYIDKN